MTLSKERIKLLRKLDDGIQRCKRCKLYSGGRAKPYWTKRSKYAIIGETPWTDEVEENEPFVGTTGQLLWKVMKVYNLSKEAFLIINSVNCKPSINPTKKPNLSQLQFCHSWLDFYLRVVRPKKILVLGNYARYCISGEKSGIVNVSSNKVYYDCGGKTDKIPTIFSVHPSYAIYNKEAGKRLLKKSIKTFKNTC